MAERRWQPPPMNSPGSKPATAAASDSGAQAGSQVRVDEKVVRKILQVNPDLRHGRTTLQVKKALEQGQALGGAGQPPSAVSPVGTGAGDTRSGGGTSSPASGARPAGAAASELDDTMAFFLRGKAEALQTALADIAARRRALDSEEQSVKSRIRDQLVSFVALLDPKAVDTWGSAALAKQGELLRVLGVSASDVIELVRKGRR